MSKKKNLRRLSIRTEREKERKSRQDRRLHNTRLLLKNYRLLKEHTKGAIFNASQAKERAVDILDGLNDYEMDDGLYIESIKKSQQRTLIILAHLRAKKSMTGWVSWNVVWPRLPHSTVISSTGCPQCRPT